MSNLLVSEPVSGGLLLSYKCTGECMHCMYACSSRWQADWIGEEAAWQILAGVARSIKPCPYGPDGISINYGLHLTGGEPFLNFALLLRITGMTHDLAIPSTFVETNCFWCLDEQSTKEKLIRLKEAGLRGVLISVNPFILEQVAFERTQIGLRVAKEVYGTNAIVYQAAQ